MRAVVWYWRCLLLLGGLAMSGCAAQFFYYPDHTHYGSPADDGLRYEPVTFASRDGTRLSGWFVPASDRADPRTAKGTVVHFHGNAQNMSAHWGFVSWLPARGFNVFVFDYRGYGDSAGKPAPKGVFEDALSALDHVRARPDVDPSRLLVLGQSLGGTNAIAAVGSGNRAGVRALVIESTFRSYSAIAHEKVPGAGWLMSDRYSADRYVAAIAPIPILFLHGTADPVVPYHHSQELHALAREPKYLVTVLRGQHLEALTPSFGEQYRDRVVDFFEAALATP